MENPEWEYGNGAKGVKELHYDIYEHERGNSKGDRDLFLKFCDILDQQEKTMNPPQEPVPIYPNKESTLPGHEREWASNPKDVCGIRKVPFSTLSGPVLAAMGNAMLEGALKYGRHNYRVVGVQAGVYFDALNRHIWAWWEGEDIDPESGKPHLIKALTCLLVLIDAKLRGKMIDNRPPKSLGFIEQENKVTRKLVESFENPVPPFTADAYPEANFEFTTL